MLDKGYFCAFYIPHWSMSSYLIPSCFFFYSSREDKTGVGLGECHAVSVNITFIRLHYITSDILVKMSFANSFRYSFPPGCPSRINMSFIWIWKKTSSKLISKNKQREGRSDWRGREEEGSTVSPLITYLWKPYLVKLSIQETLKCQSLCFWCIHRHVLF